MQVVLACKSFFMFHSAAISDLGCLIQNNSFTYYYCNLGMQRDMKSWYYLCYAPPMETCRQYHIDSDHLVKLVFFSVHLFDF